MQSVTVSDISSHLDNRDINFHYLSLHDQDFQGLICTYDMFWDKVLWVVSSHSPKASTSHHLPLVPIPNPSLSCPFLIPPPHFSCLLASYFSAMYQPFTPLQEMSPPFLLFQNTLLPQSYTQSLSFLLLFPFFDSVFSYVLLPVFHLISSLPTISSLYPLFSISPPYSKSLYPLPFTSTSFPLF